MFVQNMGLIESSSRTQIYVERKWRLSCGKQFTCFVTIKLIRLTAYIHTYIRAHINCGRESFTRVFQVGGGRDDLAWNASEG